MSDGKIVFDITGNTASIHSALNSAGNAVAQQTAKWTVLGQTAMNGLLSAAKMGFEGIKALAKNSFDYNAQMQSYEVNFKTLLGSAEAAQAKLTELKQYAVKTPFAFTDLAQATQTLLSFGVSSEDASLALSRLGDISLGDANKLQSLTLAFGQVSSAGKLAGQDLLQMINAGFNPLQVIAQETGAAYADLKAVMSGEKTSEDFQLRMEAARREVEELGVNASKSAIMLAQIGEDGMISADMVAAAMRIATSEGGLFFNALQSASETASGQIATIGDSWDTLTGKIGSGVFDSLSKEAFPKVIKWLDELNAAYDENGFEGLKGAAGGIFDEIGTLAFNTGSGIIAQIYSGITGDAKSAEDIKAYLGGLWTTGSTALQSFVDSASGLLGTIYTSLIGQEATAANISGMIGGLFSAGVDGASGLLTTCATFFSDVSAALGDPDATLTGKVAGIFTAGTDAMVNLVDNAGTFMIDLYEALSGDAEGADKARGVLDDLVAVPGRIAAGFSTAKASLDTFLNTTVPAKWKSLCGDLQFAWNGICTVIDNAAKGIADFFGIEVPDDWSLCDYIEAEINKTIEAAKRLKEVFEEQARPAQEKYVAEHTAEQEAEAQERSPSKYAGKYAHLDDDTKWELQYYAQKAIEKGSQTGLEKLINTDLVSPELLSQFRTDLSDALNSGELTVENIEAWFEDAQSDLQGQLNALPLVAYVEARLSTISAAVSGVAASVAGVTGTAHASGGLFSAATRFLGADGMHTVGESGTEALLPLDALWRKMGLIFDSSFSSSLDAMQYRVLPPLPAAEPSVVDSEAIGQMIAEGMKGSVSGLVVEMDKQEVGRIVKPVVSREIEHDISNRRWTA